MKSVFSKGNELLILLVTLFFILALFAHLVPYFGLDIQISHWLQSYKQTWFMSLMKNISVLGNAKVLPLFILISFSTLYLLKKKTAAVVNLLSVIGTLLLSEFLKIIIDRPRPIASMVSIYTKVNDKSFPSGHTMVYTIIFGFYLYLVLANYPKKITKYFFLFILSIPLILIGFSRIYLGAHWFSDVLGGYLLGSICLYFVIRSYLHLQAVQS